MKFGYEAKITRNQDCLHENEVRGGNEKHSELYKGTTREHRNFQRSNSSQVILTDGRLRRTAGQNYDAVILDHKKAMGLLVRFSSTYYYASTLRLST